MSVFLLGTPGPWTASPRRPRRRIASGTCIITAARVSVSCSVISHHDLFFVRNGTCFPACEFEFSLKAAVVTGKLCLCSPLSFTFALRANRTQHHEWSRLSVIFLCNSSCCFSVIPELANLEPCFEG